MWSLEDTAKLCKKTDVVRVPHQTPNTDVTVGFVFKNTVSPSFGPKRYFEGISLLTAWPVAFYFHFV